ncbi:hypothetical protein SDC9_160514 [bioreactor metagenome]|uniref:Uncharacterized protein n=1 Tax=bioreactor metagenome TaxID=1076179 RepID=A0A645FLA8_9ZZZZ
MVVRIHDRTADSWSPAHVALTTGFTDFNVFMVHIADLSDCRHTICRHVTEFAGGQTNEGIAAFFSHQLCGIACCTCELTAASGIQFNIVNESTCRDI